MKVENDKIKIPYYDMCTFSVLNHIKSYCHSVDRCENCVFAVFDSDGDVEECKVSYNTIPPERWKLKLD